MLALAARQSAAFVARSSFTKTLASQRHTSPSRKFHGRSCLSMKLQTAIVGLPNVGKSTLFNALTESQGAEAANYPFCTIDSNVGLVRVPDEKLEKLAILNDSAKKVPTALEFVDVAGLIKGASTGEG